MGIRGFQRLWGRGLIRVFLRGVMFGNRDFGVVGFVVNAYDSLFFWFLWKDWIMAFLGWQVWWIG